MCPCNISFKGDTSTFFRWNRKRESHAQTSVRATGTYARLATDSPIPQGFFAVCLCSDSALHLRVGDTKRARCGNRHADEFHLLQGQLVRSSWHGFSASPSTSARDSQTG